MILPKSAAVLAAVLAATATTAAAFSAAPRTAATMALRMAGADSASDPALSDVIKAELSYVAGGADTEFARRFRHLAGANVKTVGESFADFTRELGYTVNPLYKNMVTDLVGTTHLVVVNARFRRDAVWSLGLGATLDLLLRNYPEPEVGARIRSALYRSVGLDEAACAAEARALEDWARSKSRAEVEAALAGEGDSPLAEMARAIKADEFWMYSRYFGVGLIRLMELVGVEMDKDEVYPVMEDWMSARLGRGHMTACSDSDLYFKVRSKLDMMETMMKEIEIREKKRMAERLEAKAEAALRAADREQQMEEEIAAEAARQRERVANS